MYAHRQRPQSLIYVPIISLNSTGDRILTLHDLAQLGKPLFEQSNLSLETLGFSFIRGRVEEREFVFEVGHHALELLPTFLVLLLDQSSCQVFNPD